ncbi:MAG: PASTA domain-containing protein [Kineosporiaceae bacterium]
MPENQFGPDGPVMTGAAPFSVTGPTTVELDPARTAVVSFAVSNVTGRPVRARLLPQPLQGADAAWLQVVGEAERPLGVAATLTADVRITVPPQVAAGTHALRLDVAVEDQPDSVTAGQSVTFAVPAPVTKKFPWWIVVVAAVAVLVIGGGVGLLLFLTRDKAPTSVAAPTISGDPVVGGTLTATAGRWSEGGVPIARQWQLCTGTDAASCADVKGAVGTSYVIGAGDLGRTLRIVEVASTGPVKSDGEPPGPTASAASALTVAVKAPPEPMALVPGVAGSPLSKATEALAAAKLQALTVSTGVPAATCDPVVVSQNPPAGKQVPVGTQVAVAVNDTPVWCWVFKGPILLEKQKFQIQDF